MIWETLRDGVYDLWLSRFEYLFQSSLRFIKLTLQKRRKVFFSKSSFLRIQSSGLLRPDGDWQSQLISLLARFVYDTWFTENEIPVRSFYSSALSTGIEIHIILFFLIFMVMASIFIIALRLSHMNQILEWTPLLSFHSLIN